MRLRVNGREVQVEAPEDARLLAVLRDRLHLTGAKEGCNRGECGTCTVLIDGVPAYACLTLAAGCDGEITTIEGIPESGVARALQVAFAERDAAQCGFCTAGQILAAASLLEREPDATDDRIRVWMAGNLCRCGTYPKILDAIHAAARTASADRPAELTP